MDVQCKEQKTTLKILETSQGHSRDRVRFQ